MPKVDIDSAPQRPGNKYKPPYDEPCRNVLRWKLAADAGLTQFGVNLTRIAPGAWSSQRHWHTDEDEFVYVLEGELVLVTDAGEQVLRAGDCAAFRAGEPDAHHLRNHSGQDALVLEVGSRRQDVDRCAYPDLDELPFDA